MRWMCRRLREVLRFLGALMSRREIRARPRAPQALGRATRDGLHVFGGGTSTGAAGAFAGTEAAHNLVAEAAERYDASFDSD